jgi:two-component system C4-dicarboxylate transport response regulator DctD
MGKLTVFLNEADLNDMTNREQSPLFDDEKQIRLANTQTLEMPPGSALHEDAESALPLLSMEWPGGVICDIRLRTMNGLEFLAKAQKNRQDMRLS